jgi:peroxiredoxin
MTHKPIVLAAIAAVALTIAFSARAAQIGSSAPDFHGTDSNGKTQSLDQYRGKFVVLEWHNHDCPYTIKHYQSGNMQSLQKQWTAKGVVWLTVISSAPGTQGYVDAARENAYLRKMGAQPTAAILDPKGDIGHLYGAKTTPNMFVIDPSGKLIYAGAIDDHPTTEISDIQLSKNYVSAALTEAMKGQPVQAAVTRPYGCSVKYWQ